MTDNNPYQDISIKNIGTGGHYTAGSFSSRKRLGLAGELRKIAKDKGRFSFGKNLSDKNLRDIQNLIGKELAKLSKHSSGLSSKARVRIMMAGRKKMLSDPTFSSADLNDLRQITAALGQMKTGAEKTTRKSVSQLVQTKKEQIIKANIALDIDQDNWEEKTGQSQISYDPRSALGKFKSNNIENNTGRTGSKKIDLVV